MAKINVGTLTAVLKADVSKWIPSMKKAGKEADKLDGKIDGLSTALGGLAVAAGGAAVAFGAMNLAKQAAQALTAKQIYEATGGSIEKLRKATGGMISDAELVKKVNMAKELGINEKQFASLAKTAVAASKVMGLSQKEAFERMILGTAKMEKEILEETGIVFKAETAFKKYAAAHGLNAGKLTEIQKKQSFINEVIARGTGIIKSANSATSKAADGFARMSATIANLATEIGERLLPVTGAIGNYISGLIDWLVNLSEPVKKTITFFAEVVVVGGVLAGIIGSIATFAAGAAAAWTALSAAFSSPVLLAVLGIVGQLTGALMIVTFVVGLVASAWEKELNAIAKSSDRVTIDIGISFKDVITAILTMVFTLSQGFAKALDFIGFNVVEAVAGIVMVFTLAFDVIASGWKTVASYAVDALVKILKTANDTLGKIPFFSDMFGDLDEVMKKIKGIKIEKGLDLGLTKKVIKAKKEMQNTTWKFSVDETPIELAMQSMSAIGDLVERSGRGLKALLGAIVGDADSVIKKVENAQKKIKKITDDNGGKNNKNKTSIIANKAAESFAATLARGFGQGGVGGIASAAIAKGMTGAGNKIASLLGIVAPGVGAAIGQGLMSTASQFAEIISETFKQTLGVFFERFIDPILQAGNGKTGAALAAGIDVGKAGVLTGVLSSLAVVVGAVLLPMIASLAVFAAPFTILIGGIIAGLTSLLAIILAVPLAIGSMIAAAFGMAGFVMQLATQSKSFAKFGDALNVAGDILIAATEPIFEAFMPLAGVAIIVARGFAGLISSLVQIEPLMNFIFDSFKLLGLGLLALSGIIATITGSSTATIDAAFADLQAATYESAAAMADNAVATQDAADSARNFSEEILNVAAGYNVRLASSRASQPRAGQGRSLARGGVRQLVGARGAI